MTLGGNNPFNYINNQTGGGLVNNATFRGNQRGGSVHDDFLQSECCKARMNNNRGKYFCSECNKEQEYIEQQMDKAAWVKYQGINDQAAKWLQQKQEEQLKRLSTSGMPALYTSSTTGTTKIDNTVLRPGAIRPDITIIDDVEIIQTPSPAAEEKPGQDTAGLGDWYGED